MKIFCICCVRNEVDVIAETLGAALTWSDRIFVLDNGSTDGTWELLQELAREHDGIELLDQHLGPFAEELRADVFARHRHVARPGDFWCRLDADEIYVDDPRSFLAEVPKRFGFVRSATYNVYFTDVDVAAYEADPAGWLARPVSDRLRYYQNNWSEGRFVRHRTDLRWPGNNWPPNRGRIHRERIRLKHFQYRSPEQITQRLASRQQRLDIFPHEAGRSLAVPRRNATDWTTDWLREIRIEEAGWRDRVRPADECDVDRGDGNLVSRPDLMPELPNPVVDALRAALQGSRLGAALVKPLLARRQRRRNAGGMERITVTT